MAFAGPLEPPSGLIAPTHKTLSEIEPRIAINATNTPGDAIAQYVISTPGSYYLTGNLSVFGKHGIHIRASNVRIDLNGYQISAVGSANAGVTTADWACMNCEVTNGSFYGLFNAGAVALGNARNTRVSKIMAEYVGGTGIDLGTNGTAVDCNVTYGTGNGFVWGEGSTLTRCQSSFNSGSGFASLYSSCILDSCTAEHNGGDGFQTNNSVLTGCVADLNSGFGFIGSYADLYTNCRAGYNTKSGFSAGVLVTIDGCTAVQNKQLGITASAMATVRNCNVSSNSLQGIKVLERSSIIGNQLRSNGITGPYTAIWCTGDYNHVEGNVANGNGFGIFVAGTNNTIVRNVCSNSNSFNYSISAGNRVGTVTPGTTNAAIAGNSGGGLGTTDPNANFAY